jgi:hypothetical protein
MRPIFIPEKNYSIIDYRLSSIIQTTCNQNRKLLDQFGLLGAELKKTFGLAGLNVVKGLEISLLLAVNLVLKEVKIKIK